MRLKTVLLFGGTILIVGAISVFGCYKYYERVIEKSNEQIKVLNSTIDSLGPSTQCWTVIGNVKTSDEITADNLTPIPLPSAMVGTTFITDTSTIIGKKFKVPLSNGTPITTDLVMSNEIDSTTRSRDISLDYWTVGLKPGDFVDIRLVLPFGEDLIVVPKLRVEEINDVTLKINMTETDWQVYTSALVDYYLNIESGASIYATAYVEPGVQEKAVGCYAVRPNVRAVMLSNPNIVNTIIEEMNENLRASIDTIINSTTATDTTIENQLGDLQGGRKLFNSNVLSDYTKQKTAEAEATENQETTTTDTPAVETTTPDTSSNTEKSESTGTINDVTKSAEEASATLDATVEKVQEGGLE